MNNFKIGLKIFTTSFQNQLRDIFKDGGVMLILIFAALAYPLVYSIGYKTNVISEMPVAVVDMDQTQASRTLTRMINDTREVKVITKPGCLNQAKQQFWDQTVHGIIVIPNDLEKNIIKGQQGAIQLFCDASYFLKYKETLNAALKATGTFSAGVEIKRYIASGDSFNQAIEKQHPLDIKFFNLYNPSGAYGSFVMPGLIIIILQQTLLVGIGMVGGAGRENNNNQIIAPGIMLKNGAFSVILGKAFAFFSIYVVNSVFTLVWLYEWFDFPSKGSLFNVIILMIPFLFSSIFLGLAISLLFKKRENSIIFLVFLSPIILFLTGLSWPVISLPGILHKVAYVFPSTNMVPAYLRLRTMGVDISDIRFEFIFLTIQMIFYYFLACISFKYLAKKHSTKQKP